VLSQQLVSDYQTDRPDIVTVVLSARGFEDLLEQMSLVGGRQGRSNRSSGAAPAVSWKRCGAAPASSSVFVR
jgi:hypothetical protein